MPKPICMLAHLYDPKRVIFPAYIQPKLDGVRAIWKHKERRFVSRQNKPLAIPQHIIDLVSNAPFDLDGELIIPKKSFNEISRVVRHLDMISEKDTLLYLIFDIITPNMLYSERYTNLTSFCLLSNKNLNILPALEIRNVIDIEKQYQEHLNLGYEGSIIRSNTPYEFKRSFNLLKLKPTKEIICKIVGTIEGTGKYEGMLGALTVETTDKKIFNVGSGFTDFDRYNLYNDYCSGSLKLKLVKVKYQDLSEYGIPRFPIFKGFKE